MFAMNYEMTKKYYADIKSEELIDIALKEMDQLTDQAKELLDLELNNRGIDIVNLDALDKSNDIVFFKKVLEKDLSEFGNASGWLEIRMSKRLHKYSEVFSSYTIEYNTKKLLSLRTEIEKTGVLRAENYDDQLSEYLALQHYLRSLKLTIHQKELIDLILNVNSLDLKSIDINKEVEDVKSKTKRDAVKKINEAGNSLSKISQYLLRYLIGSFGIILGFFLLRVKDFFIMYTFFSVGTLVIFILIISHFNTAGKILEDISHDDFKF